MQDGAASPPETHCLDDDKCPRCAPGFPRRCVCGGLIHANQRSRGDVVLACDRCLWEGRPVGMTRGAVR